MSGRRAISYDDVLEQKFPDDEVDRWIQEYDQRSREENEWIKKFGEMVSVIDEAASIVNKKVSKDSPERWPGWDERNNVSRVSQFQRWDHSYHYFCKTRWGLDHETFLSFKARYETARRRAECLTNVWTLFGPQRREAYTKMVREKWGEDSKESEMFHRFVHKGSTGWQDRNQRNVLA